jgi:hypothetical protein
VLLAHLLRERAAERGGEEEEEEGEEGLGLGRRRRRRRTGLGSLLREFA